jgi:transcriptional regulator with PAS, ATPase and Fis domain
LFGYRRGAFTDARYDRTGRIEYASCGTLFLDEIGELPLSIQSKLLRVIEDKFITPLGSNEQKDVDVRFVFATNKNLEDLVQKKRFREDLYYRITNPCIKIPPLRERKKEIPLLVDWYLQRIQEDHQGFVNGISPPALKKLFSYEYPGNVRELQGIIKSAFLTCRGEKIESDDIELPENGRATGLREKISKFTMHIIHDQMLLHKNDIHSVAHTLKVSPRTIYRYLKK